MAKETVVWLKTLRGGRSRALEAIGVMIYKSTGRYKDAYSKDHAVKELRRNFVTVK